VPLGAVPTLNQVGTPLGCQVGPGYSAEEVTAVLDDTGFAFTSSLGAQAYTVQYVTEGPIGTARRVNALVYLPTGQAGPFPLVAVGHGTSGMAAGCGPSVIPEVVTYLAAPLVALGYAVVATDYLGMGFEDGLSPYMVGDAHAFSVLDSLRAVRAMTGTQLNGPRDFTDELFLLGHSQGGHASVFAWERFAARMAGSGFRLLGTVAFAAGLGSVATVGQLIGENPARPTDEVSVYLAMVLMGLDVWSGRNSPSDFLAASASTAVPQALGQYCVWDLFNVIPNAFPTHADLFDGEFMTRANSCLLQGEPCSGFQPWASELHGVQPGHLPGTGPVLLLQGTGDLVVQPASTACLADRLDGTGADVTTCGVPGASHDGVVPAAMARAVTWMDALRAGNTPANPCAAALNVACP
jgi:pimeloyl-ACP methyl ester carboxylesterase